MVKVNAKLTEFQVMQTIVESLLAEPPNVDVVNTTRECVDQMNRDIAGLQIPTLSLQQNYGRS